MPQKESSTTQVEAAFELPTLSEPEFTAIIQRFLLDPNLGAGIDVSGVSGSGKSNFSQTAAIDSLILGIPFMMLDPHGDSAKQTHRMALELPEQMRKKIIYWRVGDPDHVAAIDPLAHPKHESQLSEYERTARARIQIELTAEIILSSIGEAGAGFAFRPVMRKWITRWLWLLYRANLTLADAVMLLDPHHPMYELLVQLAPDQMARHQMAALTDMKVSDREAEIGSARNRIANILEHPAAERLFSRRQHAMDFQAIYDGGYSLIVDLEKGTILTDEVQRIFASTILSDYLAVVQATPVERRQRRLCIIDELPVFSAACGPLLERMCTEIRKYLTSFVFLHQGAARFPGRTENEFFQTILDMCRVKLVFRHNVDAEFFGRQIALAAHQGTRVKHIQTTPQQFTVGHRIVELTDRGQGTSEMSGQTDTMGETDQLTRSLSEAVDNVDRHTTTSGDSSGLSTSRAQARQRTSTVTTNQTVKQTLVPVLELRDIVSSTQFWQTDEIIWAAASAVKELAVGEVILGIDGVGVWRAQTPEAVDPFEHAPKYAARKLREWLDETHRLPVFATPEQLGAERQEFLTALEAELRRQIEESRRAGLESAQRYLPGPSDSSDDDDPQIVF